MASLTEKAKVFVLG